jgi:hypothetical protein
MPPERNRAYFLAQIKKCRRLASYTTDTRAAAALRALADELEAEMLNFEQPSDVVAAAVSQPPPIQES